MSYRIVSYVDRPDLDGSWDEVVGPAWPEFLYHDAVCNRLWPRLFDEFADFQLYLVDEEADRVVGQGNSAPFAWNGDPATLPDGVNGVLPLAVEQREAGLVPTTLCALQAVVVPPMQGRGLSRDLVAAMGELARRHGLTALVAPVRPNRKDRYPLTAMDRYVRWTRPDGLPFDPWMRVHARLGAEILGVCPNSNVVEGTVAEWEAWAGMEFPDSGSYVVPGALVPVQIDRVRDVGRIVEPNVWMRHPVSDGST
jgi:GNAT superfamily N-acetyltransferase